MLRAPNYSNRVVTSLCHTSAMLEGHAAVLLHNPMRSFHESGARASEALGWSAARARYLPRARRRLYIHPSSHPSICRSMFKVFFSMYLSVCLSTYLSATNLQYLSLSIPICLSISVCTTKIGVYSGGSSKMPDYTLYSNIGPERQVRGVLPSVQRVTHDSP